MTGVFDTLSSPDEIGFANWHVVKNAVTRSSRNRQRGGGWRRLFADDDPYNNQDLHNQLTDRLGYYGEYLGHAMGGGEQTGLGYAYQYPSTVIPGREIAGPVVGPYCPVYYPDYGGTFDDCNIVYPFVGYPYFVSQQITGACNTGYPNYYPFSYLYLSCPEFIPEQTVQSYPYGPYFPVYSPEFSYDYIYCGDYLFTLPGCREAITMLGEIVTSTGRKLIAATMSRVYEYNQSSGNWRILADGLGNSGYVAVQCGCNQVRGMMDTLGVTMFFTNDFDEPMSYMLGSESSQCGLQALTPISDLVALGITRAGGVVEFKGFILFYDITEAGERQGGTVIWSDLEDGESFIEGDTSFAGRATIAVGETILNAAKLGNWLIFYTDRRIIRCSLVGGDDVFNFEDIYTDEDGSAALRYKYSLIQCGSKHIYLGGDNDVYAFTQFDTRPVMVNWITKASGMISKGITEDDATYEPINEEACNMVTGGWNERTQEAWLSWPTGNNTCPNVTLRFNLKFNSADLVDHGFTAFLSFRKELRPTVGQWLEDLGVCDRGEVVAAGFKEGDICATDDDVTPLLYMRNSTENASLPVHPQSLCARLTNKTLDDFCRDCSEPATFIMASATDFTLKQAEDDIYYRERLAFLPVCDYENFGNFYGLYHTYFAEEPIVLDEWIDLDALPCGEVTVGEVGAYGQLLFTNCEIVNVAGGALPGADWNTAYSTSLTATGGTGPYTWTLVSGAIPDGMTLASNGTLSGTPTNFGDFEFSAKATDVTGHSCTADFTLNVDLGADIWLKADDDDSIQGLTNGQNVDTWFDISGNARHFTLAPLSSDVPPVYQTNILDGKPGVHFGALAGLATTDPYARNSGDSYTLFMVLRSTSNTVVGRRALQSGRNVQNFLLGPYTGFWRVFNGAFITGPAIDLNPHYSHLIVNGGTNNLTFVFDGTTIGSNVGTQFMAEPGLGNLYTGEDFLGYVFEFIIFGRVLSAQEITYVTNYLKAEWPSLP